MEPETLARVCPVCKRPLPEQTGRGRRYTACPPPEGQDRSICGRIEARFAELDTLISALMEEIEGEPDEVVRIYLQGIKSHLWREVNVLTNRGRLLASPGREVYAKRRTGWWRAQPGARPHVLLAEDVYAFVHARGSVTGKRVRTHYSGHARETLVPLALHFLVAEGRLVTTTRPRTYTSLNAILALNPLGGYAPDMLSILSLRVPPSRRPAVISAVKAAGVEIQSVGQEDGVLALTVDANAVNAVVAAIGRLQPPVAVLSMAAVASEPTVLDSPPEVATTEPDVTVAAAPVVELPAAPTDEDPDLSACTRTFHAHFESKRDRLAFRDAVTGSVLFGEPPMSEEDGVFTLHGLLDPGQVKTLRGVAKNFSGKIDLA